MKISEIKQSAKIKLKGNYVKCIFSCLLYFVILMVMSIILSQIGEKLADYTLPLTLIQAIFAIISSILSYALINNIVSIANNKTNSITNFIDSSFLKAGKYIKILLQILLRTLIPIAVFILCYFYFAGTFAAYYYDQEFLCFKPNLMILAIAILIISFICLIYFLLKYILSPYVCAANEEMNSKEIVLKSAELMKKQKMHYVLLILSFAGWIILAAFICYILSYFVSDTILYPLLILFYTLLRPYIITSESIFYENLNDVKDDTK